MTVEEITKLAMQELQVLAEGQDPSSNEESLGLARLNTLIGSLQNEDITLQVLEEAEITTVNGTAEYPTDPDTVRVHYFHDSFINVLDSKSFDQLTYHVDGRTTVKVDYSVSPPVIVFKIAPVKDGLVYKYMREVYVRELLPTEELNFTRNAYEMLILGLAYKLKNVFNAPPDLVASIAGEFRDEKMKFKATQRQRGGREIVAPNFVL
jgi:hypothetical protein